MARRTKKLAQLAGLNVYGDVAYGRMNGIFLNAYISDMDGNCVVRAFVRRDSGVDVPAANAFIAQHGNKYMTAKASFDGQSLNIVIPNYLKLTIQVVADFLSDFSVFLNREGYRSACAFCGTSEGLGCTAQGEIVMEACPACHEKLAVAMTGIQDRRDETGSYLRGSIGAILGGIVGIIPWVIIGFLNYVAAASGLIMALLAHKGYTLLKGRKGRGMLLIIIAVLIVFTYAAVIINQTILDYNTYPGSKRDIDSLQLFAQELSIPFSGGEDVIIGEYYFTPDAGGMWAQLALGWLFAALGSFFYLRIIQREDKGKDLGVKRLDGSAK